jgi:hypothetical protein
MIPVFEAKENEPGWSDTAETVSVLMSNLILFHEMGHYYQRKILETWDELYSLTYKVLAPFLDPVLYVYPDKLLDEIKCDVYAVYSCLSVNSSNKVKRTEAVRAVVACKHIAPSKRQIKNEHKAINFTDNRHKKTC